MQESSSEYDIHTSSFGQNKEMKDAKGGLSLSYTSVPSIMIEMIGRTTVWPCSGWWRTNVAEYCTKPYVNSLLQLNK